MATRCAHCVAVFALCFQNIMYSVEILCSIVPVMRWFQTGVYKDIIVIPIISLICSIIATSVLFAVPGSYTGLKNKSRRLMVPSVYLGFSICGPLPYWITGIIAYVGGKYSYVLLAWIGTNMFFYIALMLPNWIGTFSELWSMDLENPYREEDC